MTLEDVQNRPDHRRLAIDEVGVTGIRYPVVVWDREHAKQETIADVALSVDLRADLKGAHLSRFVEVLHEHATELTPHTLPDMLTALRRLTARSARIEARFSYFLQRQAPVTGAQAFTDYQCTLTGESEGDETRVSVSVRVPVTSVCPCSKAVSDYGAHNQRGHITICVNLRRHDGEFAHVWIEELIEIAEASASAPVFPLLKRPDERHVTMRAYDNPVFVEDMVRAAAEALHRDERFAGFHVEAVNDESIHNHAAYARISSPLSATEDEQEEEAG